MLDYHEKFLFTYLWGRFWNRIETVHIYSWTSVKLSQEYLVHLSWIKLASNPRGLDSSSGRAADRNPEGASSNTARVKIFQLTSAVSDCHEKFLFISFLAYGFDYVKGRINFYCKGRATSSEIMQFDFFDSPLFWWCHDGSTHKKIEIGLVHPSQPYLQVI